MTNLSTAKHAVLAEMFRVLTPGGRIGISDVVAEDHLTEEMRAERGASVGCVAGALSRRDYLDGLAAVGFTEAEVTFTHLSEGGSLRQVPAGQPSAPGPPCLQSQLPSDHDAPRRELVFDSLATQATH